MAALRADRRPDAVVYLVLTYRTYRTAGPVKLQALVRSHRRGLANRLLSSPPRQFPPSAAVLALLTTLLVIPQARQAPTTATLALTLGVCVVAVPSSWVMVQLGFAVGYLTRFVEHGGLEFPDGETPVMVDFLYFSVAVGTSSTTPDVTVTDRRMRRHVLGHSVLAFAFNTVILASAVAVTAAFLVPAS